MQLNEEDLKFVESIKMSIYRALWGEIIPTMRALILVWKPGDNKVWLYFYHDGPIEHPNIINHYSSIMAEVDADYWGRDIFCDYEIIRSDYPEQLPLDQEFLIYLRKEPFVDPI